MKKNSSYYVRLFIASLFFLINFHQGILAQKSPGHIVEGVVLNAEGNSLQGAVVEVKDSKAKKLTDAAGKFSIDVKQENAVLMITYTGYLEKEVDVNGSTNNIKVTCICSPTVAMAFSCTTKQRTTNGLKDC